MPLKVLTKKSTRMCVCVCESGGRVCVCGCVGGPWHYYTSKLLSHGSVVSGYWCGDWRWIEVGQNFAPAGETSNPRQQVGFQPLWSAPVVLLDVSEEKALRWGMLIYVLCTFKSIWLQEALLKAVEPTGMAVERHSALSPLLPLQLPILLLGFSQR